MKNFDEHEKANEQKWNQRSKSYDENKYSYFRLMQEKAIQFTNLKKGDTFLDLGCGTGWAVRHVFDLLGGEGEFIGIDLSPGMIEKAQSNSAELSTSNNIKFIEANAEHLPLEDEHYSTIICTNSFHHYFHPQVVLSEVKRVLKEGGRFYIMDVTSDDMISRLIDRRIGKKEKEHVKFYSTKEYESMFSQVGLKYIKSLKIQYPMKLHIAEKMVVEDYS